jgi:hypothetical protein
MTGSFKGSHLEEQEDGKIVLQYIRNVSNIKHSYQCVALSCPVTQVLVTLLMYNHNRNTENNI